MWLEYEGASYFVALNRNGWLITDDNMEKVVNKRLRKILRQMHNSSNTVYMTPCLPITSSNTVSWSDIGNSFDYIPPTIEEVYCRAQEQEKESNMGYEYNLEIEQRNHLKRRLDRVNTDKIDGLDKTYNLNFEGKTQDEILAALKAGNVVFEKYFFDKDGALLSGYRAGASFELVNPLADKAGAAKASEAIRTAYTAARDQILVLPLVDGLKALQEFEAKIF